MQVTDIAEAGAIDPSDFDAVIVGASVHSGHHQRAIVDWVKRHHGSLSTIPSGFFSVSLTAADDTEDSRRATRQYLDDFADETGWTPRHTVSIAGALRYREYDFVTRLAMRLIAKRGHRPTDVERDYECTDWEAVDRFAEVFATSRDRSGTPVP